MLAKERLYLTANRKSLVAEGHEKAATLYATPGVEIPQSAADKFGLVDGELPKKGKSGGGTKEKPPAKDKEKKGGQDKGALTAIAGIGPAAAKALGGAGIGTAADLAAVDPDKAPTIEGMPPAFDWTAVVAAAKQLGEAEAQKG